MKHLKRFKDYKLNESLGLRMVDGKPRTTTAENVEYGEVSIDEIDNLKQSTVDKFLSEIVRCIETNHEILATDLSDRIQTEIGKYFGEDIQYYRTPVEEDENDDDIVKALIRLINLGFSIGYINQKYSRGNWNFSKFFGYDGEKFTSENDFKKVSSEHLRYNGPDITHSSLLASSYNIKDSLSRGNIEYGENEQGQSEISVILPRAFAYGYDSGAKMVDLEDELQYEKMGTTKDRYYELVIRKNEEDYTEAEKKEYDRIRYQEDVLRYGKEHADTMKKSREEFEALSPEEQAERRKKNLARLKNDPELMALLKGLGK